MWADLITARLMIYSEQILADYQFGFRRNRGTSAGYFFKDKSLQSAMR